MPRMRDPHTGKFVPNRPISKAATDLTNELGVQSTHRMGRSIYDDYLPQLRGKRAARVYREMADGDATIGGLLFGVESLLRGVEWHAEPADDTPAAEAWAEFVESCLDDMTHTWGDHIASALTYLPYGFSAFEIVYRKRDEASGSKHSDGMWGWRKFGYRPQDTIEEFLLDDAGGVQGVRQATNGGQVTIPIEKLVVYRTTSQRGPEGRSVLRNAYRAWFFKKRFEEIMAVGVERDLAGLPVLYIPAENLIAKDATYEAMKDLVTRVKRDEQEGVILPSDRDDKGQRLYEFELMAAGGGSERLNGVLAISRAFSQDILGSVLADFMGLGRDAVGSRALADPKIELWQKALEWIADVIADTLTRHAVPRLIAVNGGPRALAPEIRHTPLQPTDVAALAAAVKDIAAAGIPIVGDESDTMPDRFRELLGFDPIADAD